MQSSRSSTTLLPLFSSFFAVESAGKTCLWRILKNTWNCGFCSKILSASAVYLFCRLSYAPKGCFHPLQLSVLRNSINLCFALLIRILVFFCMHICVCFSRHLLCLVLDLLVIPFCLLLQLADFREVVSQMLGLDIASLALPDYEIITRLEGLIHSHHHHYFPCVCLQDVARAPGEHSQRTVQLLH